MPVLNWIGKEKVINHHLDVPFKTLVPEYTFGDTEKAKENLIIHGDNLEALKALLPRYEGKDKLKLGKIWEALAGRPYKYFMVFDQNPIEGAFRFDEFMGIIRDL
jgi:hypothetical protein